MNFEGGRAKPTEVEDKDSLESMLMQLAELKLEVKAEKQKFMDRTKNQREMIKSLENIISEEVKKMHRTVSVGNIRAEYKPMVVIKMKRGSNDGE
jgi:hypothetical protein